MKILFVEDHKMYVQAVSTAIKLLPHVENVEVAMSRDAAIDKLAGDFYDLMILDLIIPDDDAGLNGRKENGQKVFYHALDKYPGMQIFVLTGSEMDEFTKGLSRYGEKIDLWGSGLEINTLDYFEKENPNRIFDVIKQTAGEIESLNTLTINTRGKKLDLTKHYERILRIGARRRGATSVEVVPLAGGLSQSRVMKCTAKSSDGHVVAMTAVKLGSKSKISVEKKAYDRHVKPLPLGFFPPMIDVIDKGACGSAGIFYSLAKDYPSTMFNLVSQDATAAAAVVSKLKIGLSIWSNAATLRRGTFQDVRRGILSDNELSEILVNYDLKLNDFEKRQLSYNWSCIHGDLHGGNVLIDTQNTPLAIDFGDVGLGVSCFDPIILELSVFFHPDGRSFCRPEDVEKHLSLWSDRDKYESQHTYGHFVTACRDWAYDVAGSDDAVLAVAYAYVLRQLKFKTVPGDVTIHLLNSIMSAVNQA